MSYRGRSSKGCEACRTRKVKCDESKPSCTRCTRIGHECRYRDQGDVLFRDQTAVAAQRAEGSWRKRAKSHKRALSESSLDPSIATSTQMTSPVQYARPATVGAITPEGHLSPACPIRNERGSPIPPMSAQDLLQLSYERFIYDFVASEDPNRPPDEPSDALCSFVPLLYQHAEADSCLTSTVNAVAYMNFANRNNSPQAATLAQESFGTALRMLSGVLADPEKAASNDALCSVHLMGIFEAITNTQQQATFATHQHGANALLQLRTIEQYYENHVSAKLFEISYIHMLLASLQTSTFPVMPIEDVSSVHTRKSSPYDKSETSVIRLVWEEAQLHAQWRGVKQKEVQPGTRTDLLQLLRTAIDLDAKYQTWEDTFSSVWNFETEPNTPEFRSRYSYKWQKLVLTGRGAPTEIHKYSNLKGCSLWAYYRTSRMFLLRDLLEILNWMFRLPDEGHEYPDDLRLRSHYLSATSQLAAIIERTCAIVLGSLTLPMFKKSSEDVMSMRGYVVLWALGTMDSILSSGLVPGSSPSQSTSAAPKAHPFDSMPRHSHDSPVVPQTESNSATVASLDVAGKREWVNSMLYYIGTELGIKKALTVPVVEGYIPIVKPRVDEIIRLQT